METLTVVSVPAGIQNHVLLHDNQLGDPPCTDTFICLLLLGVRASTKNSGGCLSGVGSK